MILKKEMIKFILNQQVQNYNEEINPEKIIQELCEVSQNYEEIIANDFDVFHEYLNKLKSKNENALISRKDLYSLDNTAQL